MTGFAAETEDAFHVILLREVTERNTFSLVIDADLESPALLASNTDVDTHKEGNIRTVTLSDSRAYAWLRLTRKIKSK